MWTSAWCRPAHWRVVADLFMLALSVGFYSVPMYALIQLRSQPSDRARIIAANNILNALFMIVSALGAGAMLGAGYSVPEVFLATALLNLLVGADVFLLVPEYPLRLVMDHRIFAVRCWAVCSAWPRPSRSHPSARTRRCTLPPSPPPTGCWPTATCCASFRKAASPATASCNRSKAG